MTILLKDEDWEGINQRCEFDVVDIIINLDDLYSKSEQMEMVVKRCNETAKAQAKKVFREIEDKYQFTETAYGFDPMQEGDVCISAEDWQALKKEVEE